MGDAPGRPFRMIVAGVGGQGTLTLAQIIVEVARRAGRYVLQSELHGMSQREGMVHACVTIAAVPVSTPVITEGTGDLLVALEPLEALRYVPLLRPEAPLLVAMAPVPTLAGYPDVVSLAATLRGIPGCEIVETEGLARAFRFRQAGGMVLLGRTAARLPFPRRLWEDALVERLGAKGQPVVERNLHAFAHGFEGVAHERTCA